MSPDGILAVVAGLVADLPAGRQSAAQPVRAGLAVYHPFGEWARGKPATALRPATSRLRLPAIATGVVVSWGSPGGERFSSGSLWSRRDCVAGRTPECGQSGGPADPAEQKIGAGVVAVLDGRRAHVGDGHRAAGRFCFATGAYSGMSACVIGDHAWPADPRRDRPAPGLRAASEALKVCTSRSAPPPARPALRRWRDSPHRPPIRPPLSRS